MGAVALNYTPDPYGCGGNVSTAALACDPLQFSAEADGAAGGTAASFTFSPEALAYTPDPYGTGGGSSYAQLACHPLQIEGEGDSAAAATAAGILIRGGFSGVAGGAAIASGSLGGRLQLAGEADGDGSGSATQTGGGLAVYMAAATGGIAAAAANLTQGLQGQTAGAGSAGATASMKIGMRAASPAGAGTAAILRVTSIYDSSSQGQGNASGSLSALAQLRGSSGPTGWERPQIAGTAAGTGEAAAALTITGTPTVHLTGNA